MVETLVLTIIIFLVIQTFIAQPFQVQQESMENSLLPGQYVLVDKLTPHFEPYQRGDVVVFTPPDAIEGTTPYIKRIIGLPGDRIEIRDGAVYVNGAKLDEPYVYGGQPTEPGPQGDILVVPAGEYFCLGDHRLDSTDSRSFGFVKGSSIIGRAWLRYWPLDALEILPTPTYAHVPSATGGGATSPADATPPASGGASGAVSVLVRAA